MAASAPLRLLFILPQEEAEKLKALTAEKNSKLTTYWAPEFDEGITFLSQNAVDAVILDPFISGRKDLEALKQIDIQFAEIPILCVLSSDDIDLASEAIKKGAEDCLIKDQYENGRLFRAIQFAVERKKKERDVFEIVSHYGLAVKGSTHGLWDVKLVKEPWHEHEENELWCSERFLELLGFTHGEPFNSLKILFQRIHTADKEQVVQSFKQHLRERKSFDVQCRMCLKNGEHRWFRIRGEAFLGSDGRPYRMAGSLVDIHSRKQAEQELLIAEEKYRSVFENSAVAITVTDEHERIVSWNSFAEKMLGLKGQDLYMRPVKSLYPEEEWARMQSLNLRKKGMLHHLETKMIRRDGSLLDVDISVTVLKTADGGKTGSIGVIRDISERKQNEVILKKLSSAVEQTGDFILITDVHGNIEYVNPAFEQNTGYSKEEVIGKTPRILKSGKHDEEFYKKLWETILSGKVFRATVTNRKKNGELYHEEQVIAPLKDNQGNVTHFVSTSRDISLRVHAEEALKRAKEQAVAANRSKSEFLANMSHEIRTPMNGIIGMTELLLETELASEQQEYTEAVKKSAEALLALINDILDLSKVEAGKLTLEPIPFDLRLAVEEIVDLLTVRAQEQGIELIVRYAPHTPRRVVGDPGRIRQILTNLVSNAVKFTEKGYVLVNVDCRSRENGIANLHFSVEDTGIGIASDHLNHIFEKFTQADASTTRRFGGTGLGLAICAQLVALMHGKIGADSELGKGSVFWFDINLPIDAARPERLEKADLRGLHVAVVEDNEINQKVLREQLTSWGVHCDIFSNGKALIQAMKNAVRKKEPYGIVILDYMLPGMDGEEIAGAIKSEPELKKAALVLLTSAAVRGDAKRFSDMGFSAYLVKPVRQANLMDALAIVWAAASKGETIKLLTRHTLKENGSVEMENKNKKPTKESPPSGRGRVLLAEDNLVNQQVAKRMLEKLGCSVDVANNGQEAVQKIGQNTYDLVFMDCMMPEMDGYAATQKIRQMGGGVAKTPIIAITANVMAGDREKCMDAGMDDYVKKPITREDLDKALKKWLATSDSAASIEEPPPAPVAAGAEPGGGGLSINRERLASLKEFADDQDGSFVESLFHTYFTTAPQRIDAMKKAASEGDAVQLSREAHGLKGSSSNLGADRAASICKEIEMLGKSGKVEGADSCLQNLESELERVRREYDSLKKEAA